MVLQPIFTLITLEMITIITDHCDFLTNRVADKVMYKRYCILTAKVVDISVGINLDERQTMEKIVFLLVLAVGYVCCKEYTPVQQCGSEKLFKNVAIISKSGLCTKLPCQFKLGEKLKVDIEFKNKNRVEKINSVCKAKVLGREIDFVIPDADKGCDKLVNATCPVKPNTDLEMLLEVPVVPPTQLLQEKIGIDVKLKFYLEDQNKEMISCFQVTAKVEL